MNPPYQRIDFGLAAILDRFDPDSARFAFFDLLQKENQRTNLVSRETSREDLERLTAESLLPLTLLRSKARRYLDIGSGGGFPAIPLLLSGIIEGGTHLVERTQKKAAALRRMLHALGLQADIMAKPFEECTATEEFDLVTMRLIRLNMPLLRRVLSILGADGSFVYYAAPGFDCRSYSPTICSYTLHNANAEKNITVFRKKRSI